MTTLERIPSLGLAAGDATFSVLLDHQNPGSSCLRPFPAPASPSNCQRGLGECRGLPSMLQFPNILDEVLPNQGHGCLCHSFRQLVAWLAYSSHLRCSFSRSPGVILSLDLFFWRLSRHRVHPAKGVGSGANIPMHQESLQCHRACAKSTFSQGGPTTPTLLIWSHKDAGAVLPQFLPTGYLSWSQKLTSLGPGHLPGVST